MATLYPRVLSAADRTRLAHLLNEHGTRTLAGVIGVAPVTLARAAAGLRLHRNTLATISEQVVKLAPAQQSAAPGPAA